MKRFAAIVAALTAAALILGAAMAAARPGWLPAAIRDRLGLKAPVVAADHDDHDDHDHDEPAAEHESADPGAPAIVRLASSKLAKRIGIQTAAAVQEIHSHKLTANAETAYDGNHYANVAPRVTGFPTEVRADLGKAVRRGEVLAVIDSTEVSGAKVQYITARAAVGLAQATYDRTKALAKTGSVAARAELEALTALNQARAASLEAEQKLRNFGFEDAQLAHVVEANDTSPLLDVVSPLDGVVVARSAVKGELTQAATPIFSVTDTSLMWLWVDVYESDIADVEVGQRVGFRVSGKDEAAFAGTVNWIDTEVNPRTRTTRVRAELSNPKGALRANQFGQAEIQIGDEHPAIVVPRAAVQRLDGGDIVFLPQEEGGVYLSRRVVARPADGGGVMEITQGLEPGQRVVTKGAFLLKTELMKDAIAADHAH